MEQLLLQTLAPAATRMIRMDHAHALSWYHKLRADSSPSAQGAVCRNICTALEIHAQLEVELFYPALKALGVHLPALDRSLEEHAVMQPQIARIRQLEDQPHEQKAALNALITALLHHVADEETEVLPAAEQLLGNQRLKDLGVRMTRRRFELARPHAAEMASDMVRAQPLKTALLAAGTLLAGGLVIQRLRRQRVTRH